MSDSRTFRAEGLELRVDAAGPGAELRARGAAGVVALRPGLPAAAQGTGRADLPPIESSGRVKGLAGPAWQWSVRWTDRAGRRHRWTLELDLAGRGVAAELGAAAAPAAPLQVSAGGATAHVTADFPPPTLPAAPGAEAPAWLLGALDAEGTRGWLGGPGEPRALAEEWARRVAAERQLALPRPAVHWSPPRPHPALPDLAPRALRCAPPPAAFASVGRCEAQQGDFAELAPAAGRLWLLAPPPLDLSAGSLAQARARASAAGLAGGYVRLATPPQALAPERLALLRATLPPLGRPLRAPAPDVLQVSLLGGRVAVWLHDAGEAGRPLGIDLATLGLHGPHHAFDFFADEWLGVVEGAVPARAVPPGGCRVLALTPLAERPQLVGSTLHVGMGTLELSAVRREAERGVLRLRRAGAHAGSVWVAPGGARAARRVAVAFRDAAEIAFPLEAGAAD